MKKGQYPVFVYGSLLSGLHNHRVLGNHKQLVGNGIIKNFAMWSIYDSFPAILPVKKEVVIGEVYNIDTEHYEATVHDLDGLEGNGIMYQRELINVKMEEGRYVKAWVYIYLDQSIKRNLIVPNGDWKSYVENKRSVKI